MLKVEWAKDNGRGGEFIKKRKYSKAKYCFECGVRVLPWLNERKRDTPRISVLGMCWVIVRSRRRRNAIPTNRARTCERGWRARAMTSVYHSLFVFIPPNLKLIIGWVSTTCGSFSSFCVFLPLCSLDCRSEMESVIARFPINQLRRVIGEWDDGTVRFADCK